MVGESELGETHPLTSTSLLWSAHIHKNTHAHTHVYELLNYFNKYVETMARDRRETHKFPTENSSPGADMDR